MGTHVSWTRRSSRFRLEKLEDRTAPAAFTVTNDLDGGPGSLRQAVLDANTAPGADTIRFDPGFFSTPRTISLTGGHLVVTDPVAITGPGAGLLTVSGNDASREFFVDGEARSFAASLSGLRLTAGRATADLVSIQRYGGAMTQVRVVELPANGALFLNGALVPAGTTIAAADLGGPAFQPAPDFFGAVAFRYTAIDGYGFAADPAIVMLTIAPVNDAPTVSAPRPQTAYEDVDLAVPRITVGDVDSGTLAVTLGIAHGTLTLASTGGLAVTGNGTRMVTLTGAAAALNAALAALTYRGTLNFSGTDALTVSVSDGSLSATAVVSIRVKSATEQAADLLARVNALQAGGSLNPGRANALRAKLRLKGTAGDIDKVQEFLAQVRAFVANGVLTEDEAAPLLEFGGILLLSVTRR